MAAITCTKPCLGTTDNGTDCVCFLVLRGDDLNGTSKVPAGTYKAKNAAGSQQYDYTCSSFAVPAGVTKRLAVRLQYAGVSGGLAVTLPAGTLRLTVTTDGTPPQTADIPVDFPTD